MPSQSTTVAVDGLACFFHCPLQNSKKVFKNSCQSSYPCASEPCADVPRASNLGREPICEGIDRGVFVQGTL